MPLSQSNCRGLLSAIETLHHPTSLDEFPKAVLHAVKQVLACNTICYNEVAFPDSRMTWITEPADALPGPALRETFNRNLAQHPLIAHSDPRDSGRSIRISDYLSQQEFHSLALYNEYYRPLNVEYQLGTTISMNPRQIIAVALDRDRPDFSEDDRLCLDLLRPHMVQAYRNLHTLSLMQRATEASGQGLVLVKRCGSTRLASDDAYQVIAQYCGVSRSSGCLPDLLMNWIEHERYRFGEDSGDLSPSAPLVISRSGWKLIVRFVWGGKAADQDMLLLEEQPAGPGADSSARSKLTPRENEVLACLSQGMNNVEIGLALSISPLTVKKHLEHIYSKMQVHRRGAAVARSLRI